MSNFDIYAIVTELKNELIGAWIQQVYILENNIVLFKLRTVNKDSCQLLIQPGERIHLTNYERAKPRFPSNFCMNLRKNLKNLRIKKIYQYNLDRIVILELGKFQSSEIEPETEPPEDFKFICEFFKDGNVVLTNSSGTILGALFYKTMRDRRILPNREFNFIPSKGQNFFSIDLEDLKEYQTEKTQTLIRALINNVNISPLFAEEICLLSGIDKKIDLSDLSDEKMSGLYQIIEDLQGRLLKKEFSPVNVYKDGELVSVSPFKISLYEKEGYSQEHEFGSFNETTDEFYSKKEEIVLQKILKADEKVKETKLSKLVKVHEEQNKKVREFEKTIELNQKRGDIIYSNLLVLQELLETITKARRNNIPWEKILNNIEEGKEKGNPAATIVEKIIPEAATIRVRLDDETITLDFRKKATELAEEFYKKSKKATKKIKGARLAIQNTLKKIEKAKLELKEPSSPKDVKIMRKKRKRRWYEAYHWFRSSDDFLVLAGRDLKSNEVLVRKYLEETDIFIHAAFRGAATGVIKTDNQQIPEETINEAVSFTICYSSAWKSKFSSADGFWVKGNQVSFSPPSGEYLPKGSFIIKGTKNIIKNTQVKLRIGVVLEGDEPLPIIEPINKPLKDLLFPIELTPGEKKAGILCKLIKENWIQKAKESGQGEEVEQIVKSIPLDEIQRLIPSGKGDLITPEKK